MQKPHPMQQFHDMVQRILDHGFRQGNRTKDEAITLPNQHLLFDLRDGFPAITTKMLAWKAARGELLGFFHGATNAEDFAKLGCNVWKKNATDTEPWASSAYKATNGNELYLGRIYSAQWTDWSDIWVVKSAAEADALAAQGYAMQAYDADFDVWVLRKGVNQLENALRLLMTNPESRRIVITGWRPDEWDRAALPSCHTEYVFTADTTTRTLHLGFQMRSFDVACGFNVALGALMLSIFAKLAGFQPGTLSIHLTTPHIYVSHIEGLKEMLSREHYPQPTLQLGDSVPTLASVEDIRGVFTRIQPEDLELVNYQSHPRIVFEMMA